MLITSGVGDLVILGIGVLVTFGAGVGAFVTFGVGVGVLSEISFEKVKTPVFNESSAGFETIHEVG